MGDIKHTVHEGFIRWMKLLKSMADIILQRTLALFGCIYYNKDNKYLRGKSMRREKRVVDALVSFLSYLSFYVVHW